MNDDLCPKCGAYWDCDCPRQMFMPDGTPMTFFGLPVYEDSQATVGMPDDEYAVKSIVGHFKESIRTNKEYLRLFNAFSSTTIANSSETP